MREPYRIEDCSACLLPEPNQRISRVGELDEEMVFESRVGDRFLLGATTWRIDDITPQRVIVSPAPAKPGRCLSGKEIAPDVLWKWGVPSVASCGVFKNCRERMPRIC